MDGKVVNRWSLWLARPRPRNRVQPAAHNPSCAGQHSVASPFL